MQENKKHEVFGAIERQAATDIADARIREASLIAVCKTILGWKPDVGVEVSGRYIHLRGQHTIDALEDLARMFACKLVPRDGFYVMDLDRVTILTDNQKPFQDSLFPDEPFKGSQS